MPLTQNIFAANVISFALCAAPVQSHEFWIEPEDYTVATGETVEAAIRVGQEFQGASYAYFPPNFRRFDWAVAGSVAPVEGRPGDRPAASIPEPGEGLLTILHVTRDYALDYDSWEKFAAFVTSKDAVWVLDAHDERGLPRDEVKESYARYAKSLVAVGDGEGQDRAHGLLTEIVALENPYADDVGGALDIQVLYDDAPRGDAQIAIFARDGEGVVETSTTMTDKSGIATIPVIPGRSYLIDAVVLRAAGEDLAEETGAMWQSLWASLTFAIPK